MNEDSASDLLLIERALVLYRSFLYKHVDRQVLSTAVCTAIPQVLYLKFADRSLSFLTPEGKDSIRSQPSKQPSRWNAKRLLSSLWQPQPAYKNLMV